jgi:fatty-acyl-CoA synthase
MSVLNESVAYFAKARRDADACIDLRSGTRMTYGSLAARAARMAAAIARVAAPRSVRGLRVAVLARNSPDFLCVVVACRGIGATLVPFNWRLSPAELAVLAELSEPQVVLFEEEFAAGVAQVMRAAPGAVFLSLGERGEFEREIARDATSIESSGNAPDDVVTLLFTSGTTGHPKAVIVSERNAAASARNFALSVDVSGDTVFLSHMPMFHVAGLFTVATTVLQTGGTLLISPQFSVEETLAAVGDPSLGVTHCFCVPQMTERIRTDPAFDPAPFRRLKVLQTGGAPHPREAVRAWTDAGVRCADGYGMSEAGTILGMPPRDLELLARKAGSAGIPAAGIQVRLLDPERREVADGEVGELWLRGPTVTSGYWRNPEATRVTIIDGWLRTGDAARRDEDGFFTLVDRFKDMYISGGENVYPAEVESVLRWQTGIVDAAVVGVPDPRWGESGAAFIVVAPGATLSDDELLAFCRSRLAGYKLPKQVIRVDELPRTASGKVRKDLLRAGLRPGS